MVERSEQELECAATLLVLQHRPVIFGHTQQHPHQTSEIERETAATLLALQARPIVHSDAQPHRADEQQRQEGAASLLTLQARLVVFTQHGEDPEDVRRAEEECAATLLALQTVPVILPDTQLRAQRRDEQRDQDEPDAAEATSDAMDESGVDGRAVQSSQQISTAHNPPMAQPLAASTSASAPAQSAG
ncbi:hypothetical protein LTR53_008948 [Teratosphaeriaceae sp. CCFEE 6253]|nr:hypothetical protein LTR53_008948 [Teratosphaeriaceae sp. CCFEE 6253]